MGAAARPRIGWPGLHLLLATHEVKIGADIDQVFFLYVYASKSIIAKIRTRLISPLPG